MKRFLALLLGIASIPGFSMAADCIDINDSKYAASLAIVEMSRHIPTLFEELTKERVKNTKKLTTSVSFGVNSNKEPTNIQVKQSSGNQLIDQSAITAVKLGAPYRQAGECFETTLHYTSQASPSEQTKLTFHLKAIVIQLEIISLSSSVALLRQN